MADNPEADKEAPAKPGSHKDKRFSGSIGDEKRILRTKGKLPPPMKPVPNEP